MNKISDPHVHIYDKNYFQNYRYSEEFSSKIPDVPRNVKFMTWLPQNDLLAHNKTKLFITHGGLNGGQILKTQNACN